jgi:hypothetical protein
MATLAETLSRMADSARLDGRCAPIIETDRYSARILASAIEDEIRFPISRFQCLDDDCTIMFDGVKIVVAGRKKRDNGFHEHFGVLAEIYA